MLDIVSWGVAVSIIGGVSFWCGWGAGARYERNQRIAELTAITDEAVKRVARAMLGELKCETECNADYLQGCGCAWNAARAALEAFVRS